MLIILTTTISLSSCSKSVNEKNEILDLSEILNVFEELELHLKPQIEDDSYPYINEIKPNKFELLDGTIFIYVLKDKDLALDQDKIHKDFNQLVLNQKLYLYQIRNIVIIYCPQNEDPQKLIDEMDNKIRELVEYFSK